MAETRAMSRSLSKAPTANVLRSGPKRLRELGIIRPNETAMLGVSMDSKRIAYVPAANLEQLAAYARQRNAVIAFRRFPIHGYAPPPR